jgi:hypothetical protein
MKAHLGPYKYWIGPYQIAESLSFLPLHQRDIDKFGDWLNKTWVKDFCTWIDSKRTRKIKVKIDRWDSWGAYETIAIIALPLLKQLRLTKQGAPQVEDSDVPEHLRSTNAPPKENEWDTDALWFDRWDWVLDEIIWSLEQIQPDVDWEQQFWIVHPKIDLDEYPEDEGKEIIPLRWKVKGECDWEGRKKYQERIDNGLRLFGVYFQNLWD